MASKTNNVVFSLDCVASDLLDSHASGNKLPPAMERSLSEANSVDVSTGILLVLVLVTYSPSSYQDVTIPN